MDTPAPRKPHTTEPWEADVVDLLEQHIQEAETGELRSKSLAPDPHAVDHDLRHANPLKPADALITDPKKQPKTKKTRDIL